MQKYLFLICFGMLVSCELFMSKEDKTQKMVDDELLAIDWNDVDQYPLFEECDETVSKPQQKGCFQNVLMGYFSKALDSLHFQVEENLNDTVFIDFEVDEHGFITIRNVEEKTAIFNQIENFRSEVTQRLNDFTVKPALKRGIPVSIRFRLPLVLSTD
ncbi:hypothetical protein GTQ34_12255 [Muricauda sp. JGD-17]|uniref:TonB C-terminal domain-containing protein n=1 Tax=Flagellimonas ochracea TaxID=2696472 RepID=A0A964TD72_9FLAO|nr:hypothetical protein [Allomuricauda ochracea]NAY92690.1 hypothetical protein [Allomuricauda ochracea]